MMALQAGLQVDYGVWADRGIHCGNIEEYNTKGGLR